MHLYLVHESHSQTSRALWLLLINTSWSTRIKDRGGIWTDYTTTRWACLASSSLYQYILLLLQLHKTSNELINQIRLWNKFPIISDWLTYSSSSSSSSSSSRTRCLTSLKTHTTVRTYVRTYTHTDPDENGENWQHSFWEWKISALRHYTDYHCCCTTSTCIRKVVLASLFSAQQYPECVSINLYT